MLGAPAYYRLRRSQPPKPATCQRSAVAAWLLGCGVLLAPLALAAVPLKIQLPPETGSFKPGPGADLANGQCLTCHSVEYVVTQPPMPRSFWDAEVKKMRDKFGAQLAEGQIEPLVTYLSENYGSGTNPRAGTAGANVTPRAPAPNVSTTASGGEAIAAKYFCLSCHGVNAKIVGPAYKDIAAKYQHDPQAAARISEQIHKGGSGKWGSVIMPPFPMVTEAETKALIQWILSRK
jgi:cytochrome c551/c552